MLRDLGFRVLGCKGFGVLSLVSGFFKGCRVWNLKLKGS